MQERWMVDRARDRLVVTAALMQRFHDQLRFGLLPGDRAEVTSALLLAQLEHAITLLEEASTSLRAARQPLLQPQAATAAPPLGVAR